jgi:hypothetical protein
MDIDLSKVIAYSKDSLQSRALMRAIMLDLYPGKTREMNVLLDVYESGVPREIKNMGKINDSQYMAYIQRIVNDYGLQENYVMEGLDAWITQCIGEGTVDKLHKPIPYQQNNSSVSDEQPQPIKHKPIAVQSVKDVSGSSLDFEVQSYVQNSSEILIVKFKGFDEKELVVPSFIDGKKVVGIGKEAYKGCKKVEKLVIAEGIEFIENESFAGCINLKEIMFPSTLKKIGNGAFSGSAVKNVILPSQLTDLGAGAFSSCQSLECIDLPNGITTIYHSTFQNCKLLRNVRLSDNLELIGWEAFSGCGFSKINLPAKVKTIGKSAFSYCHNLTNIQLNEGIVEICEAAFQNCESMTKIVIPSTVQKMGNEIFDITRWYQPMDRRRNGYITSSRNAKLTIYCYAGSMAIEYARKEGYQIENAAKLNS